MATDQEIIQVERRAELASKVAVLEERSIHIQEHLTRVEELLGKHATDEEQMLTDINDSIRELKKDVAMTIDAHVETKIEPIRDELRDYKTTFKVLGGVFSFIGAVIGIMWTRIDSWLFH
jgi:valyl-tRNA synthetase